MISRTTLSEMVPAAADLEPQVVNGIIARATAFVEGQTRRYFGVPIGVTEYLYGNGSRLLRLSEPIAVVDPAVVTVVDERGYPGGDATAITDFTVRTTSGTPPQADTISVLVRTGGGVWIKDYEYAVTYGRGYALDAGPKDIEALILRLAKEEVEAMGEELMQSETVGSYSYTRFRESQSDPMSDGWDTITAWRRTVFA